MRRNATLRENCSRNDTTFAETPLNVLSGRYVVLNTCQLMVEVSSATVKNGSVSGITNFEHARLENGRTHIDVARRKCPNRRQGKT